MLINSFSEKSQAVLEASLIIAFLVLTLVLLFRHNLTLETRIQKLLKSSKFLSKGRYLST
jgi:hypothetical protein